MAEGNDFGMGYAMGMDSNRNGGGFMGGDGWWGIILLALLFGNRGFGGFGGGGGDGVSAGFAWQGIDNGIRGIQQGLCDGFYAVNTGLLTGFNNLQAQQAQCCCETQRLIERGFCDTNNSINVAARDIIENQNAGTRAILDFLTQDKIATLTAENQTLKFAASQTAQHQFITQVGSDIVNRLQPVPVPSYQVPNPYAAYGYGGYANCGCGCG